MKTKRKLPLFAMIVVLAGAIFSLAPNLVADEPPAGTEPASANEPATPAEPEPELNSGDTAWMIVATALVLFMTIPGLSLFYGGLVRSKNILSILVQCFAITGVMSILWVVYGYSLAFNTEGGMNKFVGGLGTMFLKGIDVNTVSGTIPETVFITFQMTFAIITPALMVGAFAERMKFSSIMIFCIIWFTLSYAPICHMAWAGEGTLFHGWGVLDFAGGTVVHINAGIAALVACILVGKRKGFGAQPMAPHNVPMTVIGASMLWVGWFGFNAGSQLAADGTAGMALLVTQLATATAATVWMLIEWMKSGKPTAVGIATGAVAGLVAITPASGTAGPIGALIIGAASAVVCYYCATSLKKALGYDDSLDVFGVHCVGGIVGAVLTGVCVDAGLGGSGLEEGVSIGQQVFAQIKSIVVTIIWSGIVAFIAFKIAGALTGGCRVDENEEDQGLDINTHGESGYSS
jgi:ammonium transporter, Amt family